MKVQQITAVKSLALLCVLALCSNGVWAQSAGLDKTSDDRLPPTIPIFPLPDATLFPDASRPYFIFEPRYRAMVRDALKGNRIIGMVTLQPGDDAAPEGRPPIFPVGCAGVITDVEELPDGTFNIRLRALVKFRVTSEDSNGQAYRTARVTARPEVLTAQEEIALSRERQRLQRLLSASIDRFHIEPFPIEVPDAEVVSVLSQYMPMDPSSRQYLLERDDALSRALALIELLETAVKTPR